MTLRGHSEEVTELAFSPDGSQIVSGSHDTTVKVWDATSGAEILTIKHTGAVYSVAFSPDGSHIVSGGGIYDAKYQQKSLSDYRQAWLSELKIWDATNGEEILALKGHSGIVRSVAFSPDGNRIVSGAGKNAQLGLGEVMVCDVSGMQKTVMLKRHFKFVSSVAFSPDGLQIVSGSNDRTVKVWDVPVPRK